MLPKREAKETMQRDYFLGCDCKINLFQTKTFCIVFPKQKNPFLGVPVGI